MSYFSSKSTWLSLVDTAGPSGAEASLPDVSAPGLDGLTLSFEDFRPCFPDGGDPSFAGGPAETAEDLDYLRKTKDLRHRLFFHFKEWEFGPGLLEDYLRLAQSQTDTEEALLHYCLARHVAVTLVEKGDQPAFRLAWIETDRIIAEIHQLVGNDLSRDMYAREGLEAIRKGKFSSALDMRITKLAIRFLNLLDGR